MEKTKDYIICIRGEKRKDEKLMTEQCTECKTVLRLVMPPSHGGETIRICETCDKIYTGEMLEWLVALPALEEVNQEPEPKQVVNIVNYRSRHIYHADVHALYS